MIIKKFVILNYFCSETTAALYSIVVIKLVSMIKPGTMKNRRFETSSKQTKDFIKLVHVALEHLLHIIKDR